MPFLVPFIPAIIGATATVGAGLYAANAAGNAQDKALSAQNASTQQSLAAQQAALDRITQLQTPFINAGASVLPGIGARINAGAPNFSAPSYALPQPGGTPQPAAGGPAYQDRATGVPAGSMGTGKLGNGLSVDPASVGPSGVMQPASTPQPAAGGTPQASEPDWDAYIASRPDIQAWIAAGHGDPSLGPNQTPEQAAKYEWENSFRIGNPEPTPPMKAPAAGATPQAPAQPLDLGTASPVVANYTRPDQGQSPSASDFINPASFTASPGYQFRLDQGLRNTNASFGAKGLLQSGAALQGFNDYAQNSASQEYNNWFNQQQQLYSDAAGKFNTDRNNSNQNYADDRSYGTNLSINNRDFANQQYNTQTQNMFQLAGIGANAAGQVGNAVTGTANNSSNLFTNQGNNAANTALAQGSTSAQLAGTIGSTVSNLFSGTPRVGTPIPLQTAATNYGINPAAVPQAAPGSLNTGITWTPY